MKPNASTTPASARIVWIILAAMGLMGLLPATVVLAYWLRPATGPAHLSSPQTLTDQAKASRPELALPRSPQFDYEPPEPGTYDLPVIKAAADGLVLTPDGATNRLSHLTRGRISLLSFIYLRCSSPKACPYATGVLRQIHQLSQEDAHLARQLRLITLSFDPEHDTPQRMGDFARLFQTPTPSAEWLFATTPSTGHLQPILDAYGQTVNRKTNADDPQGPYYHPVRVFLIDRQGRIRNIYSFAMLDPRLIMADVRTLLLEENSSASSAGRGIFLSRSASSG